MVSSQLGCIFLPGALDERRIKRAQVPASPSCFGGQLCWACQPPCRVGPVEAVASPAPRAPKKAPSAPWPAKTSTARPPLPRASRRSRERRGLSWAEHTPHCPHPGREGYYIFLPKGMNKRRLHPEPRGAGWHRRANCPPKHQGLAGWLRCLTRF
jgi:hypothetical protein